MAYRRHTMTRCQTIVDVIGLIKLGIYQSQSQQRQVDINDQNKYFGGGGGEGDGLLSLTPQHNARMHSALIKMRVL